MRVRTLLPVVLVLLPASVQAATTTCGHIKKFYKEGACCGSPEKSISTDQLCTEMVEVDAFLANMQRFGHMPLDPLLTVLPHKKNGSKVQNATVKVFGTVGEYAALSEHSRWQAPKAWHGYSWLSGPLDGMGIRVLAQGKLRIMVNNEIDEGGGESPRYQLSTTLSAGGLDQEAIPSASDMLEVIGAVVRTIDVDVKHQNGRTSYVVTSSGFLNKRMFIVDEVFPEGKLVTALSDIPEGMKGMDRFCGAKYHMKHQYSYLMEGAGFEDNIYMGGHESDTYGALFVVNADTGDTYLWPVPSRIEGATPLYTGTTEYVALVLSIYPYGGDGSHIHLWVGRKHGTDFLGRNGLNKHHGKEYMLSIPNAKTWDQVVPKVVTQGTFYPISNTDVDFIAIPGKGKGEWSAVDLLNGKRYVRSLTDMHDLVIIDMDLDFSTLDCSSSSNDPLPCSLSATAELLGLQSQDPDFKEPDGLFWHPKGDGAIMIAEDCCTGNRLLRYDLGSKQLDTLAMIADENQRSQLSSVPPFSFTAASAAEFSGITPVGFYHLLTETSTPGEMLNAMKSSREQYLTNYQLHSLTSGLVKNLRLGQGSQMIQVNVEPDAEADTEPSLWVWKDPSYFNGKRTSYCGSNDCTEMRGDFVPGDVVLMSDIIIVEVWREKDAGYYTNDLEANLAEFVGYNNIEKALPWAWKDPSYFNGKRTSYCGSNDCTEMRGDLVPGDIVLASDITIIEVWREKDAGYYTDDLEASLAEFVGYNNIEAAGFPPI